MEQIKYSPTVFDVLPVTSTMYHTHQNKGTREVDIKQENYGVSYVKMQENYQSVEMSLVQDDSSNLVMHSNQYADETNHQSVTCSGEFSDKANYSLIYTPEPMGKSHINSGEELVIMQEFNSSSTAPENDVNYEHVNQNEEKTYVCPVCGCGVFDSLSIHLNLHSKEDLITALVRLSVTGISSFSCEKSDPPIGEMKSDPNVIPNISTSASELAINDNQAVKPFEIILTEETDEVLETVGKATSNRRIAGASHRMSVVNKKLKKRASNGRTHGVWQSRSPHKCPVCNKILSSRGALSKHIIIHSSLKPWNCDKCSVGFNSPRGLEHHHLQYHVDSRPHRCTLCNKSFAIENNLKEHMQFHGEKDKPCDICGKLFRTKKCVTRHRKRHFPDKKFKCELCPKSFAIKCEYSAHVRKAHNIL